MIFAVIISYLVLVLIIGIYASSKIKDTSDYLMGGYRLGIIPMTGTYMATFFSALSLLGGVGLIYTVGIGGSWYPMAWALGSAIGPIIAVRFRRVKVTSPPEYFLKRFGDRNLQALAGLMAIIGLTFNLVVQFTAMGVVWSLATGRSLNEGLIVGAAIAIIYTMLGGFFAVAWTDVVQCVVFVFCILIGVIVILTQVGSPVEIYQSAAAITSAPLVGSKATAQGAMLKLLGPYTALALFFTFLVQGPGTGTNPVYLQRMQASQNMKTALGMYKYAWIILLIVYISLNLIGVGSRILIPTMPEGMKTDWIMPYFFLQYTHPIIAGLFFAGLLAAAMSTIDSNIIVISSCTTVDILKNYYPKIDEKHTLWISRLVVLVIGIIVVLLAMSNLPMLVIVAGYAFGTLGLAFFVPLLFGLYWRRANRAGAWACILGGVTTFIIWQYVFGSKVYGIPALGPGILAGALLMWVVSSLTPPDSKELWGPYIPEPKKTM